MCAQLLTSGFMSSDKNFFVPVRWNRDIPKFRRLWEQLQRTSASNWESISAIITAHSTVLTCPQKNGRHLLELSNNWKWYIVYCGIYFAVFVFGFYSAPQCSHCKRCISYGNSVCPSVRPSHAGIVSKRRHVARCSLHCRIAKCV